MSATAGSDTDGGFRLRAREASRIEGLSDAVFGFAITLLVASLEVPRTFTDLVTTMKGFFAFALSFAMLFLVWHIQHRFFRRYGLQDGWTLVLTAVLLFVVLFFTYPLKFLFSYVFRDLTGASRAATEAVLTADQVPTLMVIYGSGYTAVFAVFAMLHLHAYRRRAALELNALETYDTLTSLREMIINVAVGIASMAFALASKPEPAGKAGLLYILLAPSMTFHGYLSRRLRRRLEVSAPSSPALG